VLLLPVQAEEENLHRGNNASASSYQTIAFDEVAAIKHQ